MRKFALFVGLCVVGGVTWAGDCPCPTPKRLSCDELTAKKAERCPPDAPQPPQVVAKPCPETKCPDVKVAPCAPCATCPPAKEVLIPVPGAPAPQPAVRGVLGGGPMVDFKSDPLDIKWGATLVGGVQFANGLQVVAGPTWMPKKNIAPTYGNARRGCTSIPFVVDGEDGGSPWGAQALVMWVF